MPEELDLDETVALSAEELDAMDVVLEEEDETGAPEKVAWPHVNEDERLVVSSGCRARGDGTSISRRCRWRTSRSRGRDHSLTRAVPATCRPRCFEAVVAGSRGSPYREEL
jgi:hypothetical protein